MPALEGSMRAKRRVSLFKDGRHQAIRIPPEFELPGDEAILSKDGDRLFIERASPRSLLAVLDGLEPLDEEFPTSEDLPPDSAER
jgi:antitoxin VapB